MICSLPLFASSAYMAPSGAAPQQVRAGSVSMDISKPSKAMPFLTAPAAMSSGLVGAEAGFDPLYFSDFLDIKWLREAELKHGRICMLASTGILVQEFASLPGNLGFDPLQFGKNPATRERLELQELTHGRLAMIAFSGMLHQVFVTGKPVVASLGDMLAP